MTVTPTDAPAASHSETIGFVRELYAEARREKRSVIPRWNRYYRMLRNRTWSEYRSTWMPSPQSSEIFPTFDTLVSWMTSERPIALFSPRHDLSRFTAPPTDEIVSRKAKDLELTVESWYIRRAIATQMQMALWDTMTYGCGVVQTGWDADAEDGLGDASLLRVDPYSLLPDPEASSFDDARYVLEVSRVPLFEIARRFPERGHLVRPDSAQQVEQDRRPSDKHNFEVTSQSNLAATGVTGEFPGTSTPGIPPLWGPGGWRREDYAKSALLIKAWVRSEDSVTIPVIEAGEIVDHIDMSTPRWDMVAVCGDVVLTPDVTNPFEHGGLPYHRIPFVEIGEFWSLPLAEHLAPAQVALNRLLAALQMNAELTGNPILLEDQRSGISRTKILNRPGGRLTKNAGSEIRWLDPPQVSPVMKELVYYWRDTIDRISGISAVARGAAFRRREPAQAVDTVMEASSVRIQAVLRNMEEGLRSALYQIGRNVCAYYLEPRVVPLIGPSGSEEYLTLGAKHFYYPEIDGEKTKDLPLTFDCWIEAGSSLPISHQAKVAEIDTLFFMGAADEEAVLETHKVPGWKRILERVKQRQAQQAEQGARDPRKRPGGA